MSLTVPATITDPPSGYPSEWEQSAVLKDGGTVRIRPIVPADSPALQTFVKSMSTESSYFRFFRVKRQLEPDELEAFTHLDYDEQMAFVAIVDGELAGVGRYNSKDAHPGLPKPPSRFRTIFRGRESEHCSYIGSPRTREPRTSRDLLRICSPTTTR